MPLTIYAKPGTHSARMMRVKHKRKPPLLNDCFLAKDSSAERHAKWERFCVCEIRDLGHGTLFFLERM
jgi:hypothetical protein